jgi:hypothetical protein
MDGGYVVTVRTMGQSDGRLVYLPDDDSPTTIVAFRGFTKSWCGSEVGLFNAGTLEVRRWPTMDLVHSVAGYHPTIDWTNRLLLVSDGDNHRHVIESIDTKERRYVPYGEEEPQFFYIAGHGVAEVDFGFELVGYLSGWRTRLCHAPHRRSGLSIYPTRDGRGFRAVMGNRPFRFDIDFATGQLLTELPDLTGRQAIGSLQLWNRSRDDVIVLEDDTSAALCDMDGNILTRLPPTGQAKQWFDDGRALLVTHPTETAPLQIDVWRLID